MNFIERKFNEVLEKTLREFRWSRPCHTNKMDEIHFKYLVLSTRSESKKENSGSIGG